ncbi:hypothetical protein MKS88_002605 [Plasmodium brasilianum]|uniref:Uncharacterized protein n=1 Tax=Plasmodium brasilianum TaxID=5824 RepID=A0ACB9YDB2_PLABR|nr:hypothetical protein MKS88_002605 [Plasmodium brasilianum]
MKFILKMHKKKMSIIHLIIIFQQYIKINETYIVKNLNLSNSKNVRYKTIVEIHMNVHNECRNKERQINEEEFLSTLLQMFTEEEYTIYPNLTNDELMENIKCINDIEKQKLL